MINVGLEDSNRREVTLVLNNLLSDEYLRSAKTKNYHWNVAGHHFHDLHTLFEVKHFNELRERPTRRMLTLDEEKRILDAAPVHLRVAIILLSQTGGRTIARVFPCVGHRWISNKK